MKPTIAIDNAYIESWKQKGGKVVGTVCCHIPEEIIHAAGMLPVRIRGTECTDDRDGELWMTDYACGFCRACLQNLISGKYHFLDGIVISDGCMFVQRLYDNWKVIGNTKCKVNLNVPRNHDHLAVRYFVDELKILKEEMEKLSGREITDEALNASIDLYNETRALIRELFSLTKGEHPFVSGTETLQWTIKAMSMPKEIYNQELKAFIEEAKGREPITGYGARLMMIGSAVDDPDYVHIFEEHGGLIVTDYNCYGTRYLWQDVTRKEGETPLESIARSYLEKLTCPRMTDLHDEMYEDMLRLAKEFDVDGIVYVRLKNCCLWGGESVFFYDRFKEDGYPVLTLEKEEITTNAGQVGVRAEAFVEMLEGGTD